MTEQRTKAAAEPPLDCMVRHGMLLVADKFWPRTEGRKRAFFTLEWFATGKKQYHRVVLPNAELTGACKRK